jgi:hypothetical protein
MAPCCWPAATSGDRHLLVKHLLVLRHKITNARCGPSDECLDIVSDAIITISGVEAAGIGLVSRVTPVHTAMRNCTRDEGRPFEFGNQVLISSHRKLLSSKAMVVNVAETSGHDPGRHG